MSTSTLQAAPVGDTGLKLSIKTDQQSLRDMLFLSHANPEANELPKIVSLHQVSGWPNNEKDASVLNTAFPAIRHDRYIVTFAGAKSFESEYEVEKTHAYCSEDLIAGVIDGAVLDRTQARNL